MKSVLLDTSFILTAVKNKIDLFEELLGYSILIPKQVINEISGIAKSKSEANLALKILEKNKFKKIDLKTKNTDKAIINYAKEHPKIIIATLDRQMKSKIKNPKMIIRNKKKLEIV